eukprot:2964900-Amphidinium_carterae.1
MCEASAQHGILHEVARHPKAKVTFKVGSDTRTVFRPQDKACTLPAEGPTGPPKSRPRPRLKLVVCSRAPLQPLAETHVRAGSCDGTFCS